MTNGYQSVFYQNFSLIFSVYMDTTYETTLWKYFYDTLINILKNLIKQRIIKSESLNNLIQQKNQILEAKNQKIARLEAALVNPHQLQN